MKLARALSTDVEQVVTFGGEAYKRHRLQLAPVDVLSQTVWLYDRFNLSYRDTEEPLTECGITVSCETNRLGGYRRLPYSGWIG